MNRAYAYSPRNYRKLVADVMTDGKSIEIDGFRNTIEVENAHLMIANPLDRIVTDHGRGMNLAFGIAEWVSLMTGENLVSFFKPFVSRYSDYSTDGTHVDGAYGPRLLNYFQISGVINKLVKDANSRQAVIAIYEGNDLQGGGGKNTPCTLNLQFLIRNSKLDVITTMRSNDTVWGLTYDAFMFTMLQEFVARQLSIGVGHYYHNAGSLHIYDRDFGLLDKLGHDVRWPRTMRPMPLLGITEIGQLRKAYVEIEQPSFNETIEGMHDYLADLAYAARAFVFRHHDRVEACRAFSHISDTTVRYVTRPWLVKAGVIDANKRIRTLARSFGRESDRRIGTSTPIGRGREIERVLEVSAD